MTKEMTMLHRTNDSFRATNPADEFLGPEPEDEDELPEPTVEEVWDGGRGEYVHEVTFDSGRKYIVSIAQAGAHVGDYDVVSPDEGVIANGFLSPEKAIDWLCDPERRDW
jgi:hypothetical protein